MTEPLLNSPLVLAMAEVGRLLEELEPDERFDACAAALEASGIVVEDARALNFLLGTFVSMHALRMAIVE